MLSVLTATFSLCSCSKKVKDEKAFLYGDWNIISSRNVYDLDGRVYDDEAESFSPGEIVMTFGTDQHFTTISPADPESPLWTGTYDMKNDKLLMTSADNNWIETDTMDYTVSANKLSLVEKWITATDSGANTHVHTFLLNRK